ncbi:hypothetical protein HELRODRAFT_177492 [Helobdella robusta]|uniref:Uncharacterized protein n=1 Tax=Helobdella robusta TaxID=6412 RepID=T1FBS4_HELRO|nr:hypothetical protein HELRODRAFT_177492 [Helobdella robusta]ESN97855.1 hypothetical protein HELRODRAFT_177492 [Helobdella robusta]
MEIDEKRKGHEQLDEQQKGLSLRHIESDQARIEERYRDTVRSCYELNDDKRKVANEVVICCVGGWRTKKLPFNVTTTLVGWVKHRWCNIGTEDGWNRRSQPHITPVFEGFYIVVK